MRIGELAQLSNTPTRSLRYYEEQGLIKPRRLDNGYRTYDDYNVNRVVQIRGLLDSGIPTRIINLILPCLEQPRQIVVDDAEPELLELLAAERDRMTNRIECLTRNRDAIASYLDAVAAATEKREPATDNKLRRTPEATVEVGARHWNTTRYRDGDATGILSSP